MRLTCPNCDAQYEVDDAVIPPEGRDVQCSNCGQTWFQRPDGAEEDDLPDPLDGATTEAAPETTAPEPDQPAPRRRDLDPSVVDVLREEAEREQRARASASGAVESQPDLGLDNAPSAASAMQERIARMRGEEGDAEEEEAQAPGTRRDLLPDIEEINSTLDPAAARNGQTAVPRSEFEVEEEEHRNGFRRGFALVLLLGALLVGLYVYAPRIGALHPALEGAMARYVDVVDSWRLWANTAIPSALQGLTDKLNSLTG